MTPTRGLYRGSLRLAEERAFSSAPASPCRPPRVVPSGHCPRYRCITAFRAAGSISPRPGTAFRSKNPLPGRHREIARDSKRTAASSSEAMEATTEKRGAEQSEPRQGLWQRWAAWWDYALECKQGTDAETSPQKARVVLLKLMTLLSSEKKMLIAAFGFGLLAACIELAIPHYVAKSIFACTQQSSEPIFRGYLSMLVACCTGYAFFAGLRAIFFALVNMRLVRQMRSNLFRKIVNRDMGFHDKAEVGILTSRLGSDCQSVARLIGFNINVLVRNLLQCIGGAIYLVMLSPVVAAACACVTLTLWGVSVWYSSISRKLTRSGQDALADTTQVAEEVLSLIRTVRTFGTEAQEVERYQKSLERIVAIATRYCAAYALYLSSSSFLFNATKIVTIMFGGFAALNGTITAEQLTAFVLYVEFVTSASLAVGEQYAAVIEAVGSTEKVVALMDAKPAAQICSGKQLDGQIKGVLELENVTYRYPSRPDPPALQGVTLTIQPGELTAFVGLSGSGKSTVMSLLQRLYDPEEGDVLLDGTPLRALDSQWYRRQIGVVSQEPKLFSTCIKSNIAYGLEASDEEIEAAARASNAHEFISQMPEGYNTHVTSGLLSGGQKQRLVIARALLRDPSILLLDEATSALDAESEALVQSTLDKIMEESQGRKTVVAIAHRLSTVKHAQQIVVMDKGRVAEIGTHLELCSMRGIYWELLQRQGGGIEESDFDLSELSTDMSGDFTDSLSSYMGDVDIKTQNSGSNRVVDYNWEDRDERHGTRDGGIQGRRTR